MKRLAIAGAAVAAVAGFSGGLWLRKRKKCPPKGTRVVLIGDSLAVGLAPLLAQHALDCGIAYEAYAEGATRTQQWDGQRLTAALSFKPTALLVSLGGNDFRHSVPETIDEAARTIVERAHKAGADVFWIMPPPMPHEDKAGAVAIWTRRTRYRYPTASVDFPQASDAIHPTPAGYRILADSIWKWLTFLTWA